MGEFHFGVCLLGDSTVRGAGEGCSTSLCLTYPVGGISFWRMNATKGHVGYIGS